jgi:hypothetical protein
LSAYDIDGSSTTKEGTEKLGIREIVREEIVRYFQDPLGYEEEFKGWIPEWITTAGIDVPIGQVIGFSQYVARAASPVVPTEGTTSAAYTNLATTGPELTDLPDGQYLILFGAGINSTGTPTNGFMGVKVNSTEADDDDACHGFIPNTTAAPGARAITKTLDGGGSNTLLARYRSDGSNTVQFRRRWLVAVKYANV